MTNSHPKCKGYERQKKAPGTVPLMETRDRRTKYSAGTLDRILRGLEESGDGITEN